MAQTAIQQDKILILDFGSATGQQIARAVRAAGVYCELKPWNLSLDKVREFNPKGIILGGRGGFVSSAKLADELFSLNIPILALDDSAVLVAEFFGGAVDYKDKASSSLFALQEIRARGHSVLLKDIQDRVNDAGHGLLDIWFPLVAPITRVPQGFKAIATNAAEEVLGIANEANNIFALQGKLEVEQTPLGDKIIERFAVEICQAKANWTVPNIVEATLNAIRARVGVDEVLLGLSGGVDSSVVAALLHKAIGKQLTCVFVDHGLLRYKEADQVMQMFAENMGIKVIKVDAADLFMRKLAGETDPEVKRKIIGHTFIEVFNEEAAKLTNIKWLAQGTIYPDIIESVGTDGEKPKVIKSHHNVGGLPEDMQFKLLEPLQELFKDEVRKLGVELGLPAEMVYRHPFPGPGLGVRILGEIKAEYADILRLADNIFIEELRASGWYDKTSQAFVVFLPVKSVGMANDERRYDYVVSLRAVETLDFMTARWAHLPYDLLERVSNRIIMEIPRISRVAYDVSSKPPATIEWE